MNISYNWLKQYIQIEESPEELARILTDLGLEIGGVEKVESIKGGLEGLVVGEIKDKWQHPNADKLSCTKVDVGGENPLNIVCGAPNVDKGQKVIVATVGTVLYSGEDNFKIKKSKLRGELSEGMICAEDEIGLGKSHDGILVLPNNVEVGTLAKDYFNLEEDYILEVDITPNRADALSHYGVARDLSTYYQFHGKPSKLTFPSLKKINKTAELPINIDIKDKKSCPRYSGITIKGVNVSDSPEWLVKRLNSIGLTPVNNVVDITNFVMHELGQPLHAFDYSICGENIIIKSDLDGVNFKTLDGENRVINKNQLMICNATEPMCIAGVFGGEESGVSNETKDIFIESAYFSPVSVRKTSKIHALKTDASYRFERGVDPELTVKALQRAANLIQEVAGGEIASEINDVVVDIIKPFEIEFSYSRCNSLIGDELPKKKIKDVLQSLEIEIVNETEDKLNLKVPTYRVDVQRECDVIEDILRIYGYNSVPIPVSLKSSIIVSDDRVSPVKIVKEISNLLVSNGFHEIMNNSLTKKEYYNDLEQSLEENHIELLNPLSQDLNILRRSLLFGGLESIARNNNMKNSNLKFFEFGKTYSKNAQGDYNEAKHLSLFVTGMKSENSWVENSTKVSFYTIKGYVSSIVNRLGISKLKTKAVQNEFLSEGVGLYFKKTLIIEFGKIKNRFLKATGVKQDVYFADINWDEVLKLFQYQKTKLSPISKFHPVKRDLSLLLNDSINYSDLERIAFEVERKILKKVELFDIYQGPKLPKGKKSYALSFILQSDEFTLKDKQIENTMQKLQNAFQDKLGAELR
ncbi:MAG: phenylalanine--tRNA ligase subunit beta [Flavobacteriales bacterium]|nr:phenylalanine--tRNA ligase subunit beta [Flavobacteriales bacterium]